MWKKSTGLGHFFNALRYSLMGLRQAYRSESAFRQEVWVGLPALVIAWVLPLSWGWHIALTASIVLLWMVELLNSAIEAVVDRVSLEEHPLSKNAKDFGSAAVFCALVVVSLIWLGGLYQAFVV